MLIPQVVITTSWPVELDCRDLLTGWCNMTEKSTVSNADWRDKLTPEQFHVTRERGTERAFSHPFNLEKRNGTYFCVCCGAPLFTSETKFDSGSGWPSFFQPVSDTAVREVDDRSHFMRRTEIVCANCDAHLGHVFPDGPAPSGLRYCTNGLALDFKPDQ